MKKMFAGFVALLMSCAVLAQTFPVQNLHVLGTSTLDAPLTIANGGTGASTATAATSALQYLQGATGSVARSLTSKFQDIVNAVDFGALCNGVHDDTNNIQAAINTGGTVFLPGGQCVVTNALTVATKGQWIHGQGRQQTIILIPATFNLSAQGVFVATTAEEGPIFTDFKVQFMQPDTAVRANLTNFPPAFEMRSTPRFTIRNVKCTLAMTCIDMAGGTNSGGATIDNFEYSAFNVGIDIDGALDSVRIDKPHFYPFDLSANQTSIFNDGTAIGIRSGRADDFHLSNGLFLTGGTAVKFIQTASGNTFGSITNTDFDTYGGLTVQAGQIQVTSSLFTVGFSAYQAINQTGGYVSCSACKFYANVATTNPLVQVSGTNTAYGQIDNSLFQFTSDMQAASVAASSGGNTLILTGNQFLPPQNTSPTNPIVNVGTGGRITAIGNRVLDKGTGSGNFISVAADDQHVIAGNAFVGWGMSLPGTLTNTVVYGNSNSSFTNKLLGPLTVGGNLSTTGTGAMPLYGVTGTAVNAPHMVSGSVALTAGAATVTFSGAAVFAGSYVCSANDASAAAPVQSQNLSGTQVHFVGTGTDSVVFACVGN